MREWAVAGVGSATWPLVDLRVAGESVDWVRMRPGAGGVIPAWEERGLGPGIAASHIRLIPAWGEEGVGMGAGIFKRGGAVPASAGKG